MAKILDGKAVAASVLERVRKGVEKLGRAPTVVFVRVGDHPASVTYVRTKQKAAASVGINSRLEKLPDTATQAEIIATVERLGADKSIDAILVQSPLPKGVCARTVFDAVPASKDVDGFSSANLGRLAQDDPNGLVACTPLGILEIFHHYQIPLRGKHVVVIGRSLIVGRPLATLLGQNEDWADATVTSANSSTENLPEIARSADILISAAGCPGLVKADWVKPGATVIDVGITRVDDPSTKRGYRLSGDVDFASVEPIASAITPVPGGVGPMTVAMLMANTLKAAGGSADSASRSMGCAL